MIITRRPRTDLCTCTRCSGVGRIDGLSNVLGGICFRCSGSGLVLTAAARAADAAVPRCDCGRRCPGGLHEYQDGKYCLACIKEMTA